MNESATGVLSKIEVAVAVFLGAVAAALHLIRLFSAGALWRDEAAAVQLSRLPNASDVLAYFPHEAFPLLFPGLLRTWSHIFGNGDLSCRVLGFIVGVGILAVLWWLTYKLFKVPPILSLAFLGFNSAFLDWGDSMRAYGIGTLLVLVTSGLTVKMLTDPTWTSKVLALVFAIGSVQCLFQNVIFVSAICVAASVVAFLRGARRLAIESLSVGFAAGLTLLPYVPSLVSASNWDQLIRYKLKVSYIIAQIANAFSSSGTTAGLLWVAAAACSTLLLAVVLIKPAALGLDRARSEPVVYSGVALLIGLIGYVCFLKLASHPVRAWHVVPLIGFAAGSLELLFAPLRQGRQWSISLGAGALVCALCSVSAVMGAAQTRQTNVDEVAAALHRLAEPQDLIVVAPWHNGISFGRYYHGPADWITAPAIADHSFHRYDLIKSLMQETNQQRILDPVKAQIEERFRTGHHVWLVGEGPFPSPTQKTASLPPAPSKAFGWAEQPYTTTWTVETMVYLINRGPRIAEIPLESATNVNKFERLWLKGFEAVPH